MPLGNYHLLAKVSLLIRDGGWVWMSKNKTMMGIMQTWWGVGGALSLSQDSPEGPALHSFRREPGAA